MSTPVLLVSVNAGDGADEHPTQGLLDIFTIRQTQGPRRGADGGSAGRHRSQPGGCSNIHGLTKLVARVIVCGPPTLIPPEVERLGVEFAYHLKDILPRCDVINVLRIQFERQCGGLFLSIQEYSAALWHAQRPICRKARPDLSLLAPGPINRGVELTPEVADGPNSAILRQVSNGLAGAHGGAGAAVRTHAGARLKKVQRTAGLP